MITSEQLQEIGGVTQTHAPSESTLTLLREKYPQIHFTYCMDDDVVAARPVVEFETFNLYLIDSRNHCLSFTQDQEIATGVVVAEIDE
ncbi:MAG: DUF6129 family protein [Candidatus Thiodiazotropha sp.]|jgi:hypothetical protein